MAGHGVPVEGHGKDDAIGREKVLGNGVEVIVKGAGLTGGITGLAAVTTAYVHQSGIVADDGVALGPGGGDKGLCHGGAVAVCPGRAGEDNDFLTHGIKTAPFTLEIERGLCYYDSNYGKKEQVRTFR